MIRPNRSIPYPHSGKLRTITPFAVTAPCGILLTQAALVCHAATEGSMPPPEPSRSKLVSRIQSGLIVAQFALFVAAVVTVRGPSQRGLPLSHRQNTELFLFL